MGITHFFKTNLIIFLIIVSISYILDITRNNCDNLTFYAKINNLVHHFIITYLWFGSIILGYHEIHILYMLLATFGWYMCDGYCWLTIQYNKTCNYEKNTMFHDLVYTFSNYETNYTFSTIFRIVFIYNILYLLYKYCF